jgi:hypothetical protein
VSRLDEMAAKAATPSAAEAPAENAPAEEDAVEAPSPARIALRSITIGDLAGFLFKFAIAAIVVAFPFAVIAFLLYAVIESR